MNKSLRLAFKIGVNGAISPKFLEDDELATLQEEVGGYIEEVIMPNELPNIVMIVNEDGISKKLPSNLVASTLLNFNSLLGSESLHLARPIVGNAVLVKVKGDEIVSFEEEDIDMTTKLLEEILIYLAMLEVKKCL